MFKKSNYLFVILALLALILIGCTEVNKTTVITDIENAENSVFTDDGRYFVTAGNSIYEIIKNELDEYEKIKLATPDCTDFNGIVQKGNYLYANMNTGNFMLGTGKSYLVAAPLNTLPEFSIVSEYENVGYANSLTIDDMGNLYIANSWDAFNSIYKVTISNLNPYEIVSQSEWYNFVEVFPNGIKFADNTIYYTTAVKVKSIEVNPDGSPGNSELLYTGTGFFDDLMVTNEQIVFCDYLNGRLVALDRETGYYLGETKPITFDGPSSVVEAKSPIFIEEGVLVTERNSGIISFVMLD